jgi:hypothetical protein
VFADWLVLAMASRSGVIPPRRRYREKVTSEGNVVKSSRKMRIFRSHSYVLCMSIKVWKIVR